MKLPILGLLASLTLMVSVPVATSEIPTLSGTETASITPPFYLKHTREVINKKSSPNQRGSIIGTCSISSGSGTCTITSGKTAQRTIQVGLGLDRRQVAAKLGISSSQSTTVTVGCQSSTLKAGQTWKAWSKGTRYTYRIKETVISEGLPVKNKTSGTLTAFNPYSTSIICGLR